MIVHDRSSGEVPRAARSSSMIVRDRSPREVPRAARSRSMIARASIAMFALAGGIALAGCARCSGESSGSSGETGKTSSSAAPLAPAQVAAPSAWTLATVRMPTGVAAPERCRYRAELRAAEVPITTHFAADPRTLGLLVAAETRASPPAVRSSGELTFAPNAVVTPGAWVPWPDAASAPRLARLGDSWVGAWDVPRTKTTSEVVLFRGGAATSLGEGDLYVTADLACGPSKCALLTSRRGRVAPSGADVLLFDADPKNPPRPFAIEPEGDSAARPFGLASVEGPRGAVAVLVDRGEAQFWSVDAPPAASPILAKLPAPNGVLDAMWLGDRAIVLTHGNVVDDKGCAREGSDVHGAKLTLVRGADPPIEIRAPGPPILAALRPLEKGALALWLSPLGCGADRRVLFGVVLDSTGAPVTAPIPIGDADTFAAATTQSDVDIWLRNGDRLFWMRLTCS